MRKVIKVLALLMCAMLLLSLAACNGPSFMSASKVKKLVKEFGTPQAKMTLKFKSDNKDYKYVITYDLLLDKAPITVINFINLVNDGFYDEAILDTYTSSNNYFLAARYTYRAVESDSTNKKVAINSSGITMAGEFKSNGYAEPEGGYAEFSILSLAMYHDVETGKDNSEKFNSANGALILSTATSSAETKKPLNYANYAVFAKMSSISVFEGDDATPIYTHSGDDRIAGDCLSRLTKSTNTVSFSVATADGETKSVYIMGSSSVPRFVFSIEMLGEGTDWSKLPKVN